MIPEKTTAVSGKRKQVLEATLKLAVEKGFQGTSTAAIAEEAQVGMGTIYRYFESKEVLLKALFNLLTEKFRDMIVSNYDFNKDPYANFRNLVYILVRYYIDNPYEFKYLERYSDVNLNIDKRLDETSKLVEPARQMLNAMEHGISFKKLPPLVMFALVYGPLVAIVNLVHMKKIELTDELLNEVADACWDSILEK